VLSNPSQASIEVLQHQQQQHQDSIQTAAEPEVKTTALTPLPKKMTNPMMESSSSGLIGFFHLCGFIHDSKEIVHE
jgi:hypothetical protein